MPRPKLKAGPTAEARREYQRVYYLKHTEKAKEYQRLYNQKHKKKHGIRGKGFFVRETEAKKTSFSGSTILRMPAGPRLILVLNGILAGEFSFSA